MRSNLWYTATFLALLVFFLAFVIAVCSRPSSSVEPTNTPTEVALTATPADNVVTPTALLVPSIDHTASATPLPTRTPILTATATSTVIPTMTPTETPVPTFTVTPMPSSTSVPERPEELPRAGG